MESLLTAGGGQVGVSGVDDYDCPEILLSLRNVSMGADVTFLLSRSRPLSSLHETFAKQNPHASAAF